MEGNRMKLNKNILWTVAAFLLPLIMAADKPDGFDLYYLFVENIFGGFWWAMFGFILVWVILGMISRMSVTLLVLLIGLWVMVNLIGAVGWIAVLVFFVGSVLWVIAGVSRLVGGGG
jgi:hypothetical protein